MAELETRVEDHGSRWQLSLLLNGTPVSGTGIVKKRMQIGSVTVRMGGIAGLWTDQNHRLKGYASRAMWEAVDLMAKKGYETSILFGIVDFYHRYGYVAVFPSSTMAVETDALMRAGTPLRPRMARKQDLDAVRRLYVRYNAGRSAMAVRSRGWVPAWRMPRLGEGTVRRPGRVLQKGS